MPRYLITGGAGFIGSHIAQELVRTNMGEVVVLDDLSSGRRENISHMGDAVRFIKGDVRNPEDLSKAMHGIDCVFHEAAFVSVFDSYNKPRLTSEINIVGTVNVLDAARDAGVRRVVLASSASIYGDDAKLPCVESARADPRSPYAISKLTGEFYARIYAQRGELETVCLRYFNVFGPRQNPSSEYSGVISRFVDAITSNRQPVIFGDGLQTRDFIFVRDVARANILAATGATCGAGEMINIGSGVETSLLDVIHALGRAAGREIRPHIEPQREGDIRRSAADVALARTILKFDSEVTIEDGLRELLHSCSKQL